MTLDRDIQFVLALAALTSFVFVFYSRVLIRANVEDEYVNRRFIFADALLIIAAIEMVADALRDIGGDGAVIAEVVRFAARGALMAGALALGLSARAERRRRHALDISHHRRAGDQPGRRMITKE